MGGPSGSGPCDHVVPGMAPTIPQTCPDAQNCAHQSVLCGRAGSHQYRSAATSIRMMCTGYCSSRGYNCCCSVCACVSVGYSSIIYLVQEVGAGSGSVVWGSGWGYGTSGGSMSASESDASSGSSYGGASIGTGGMSALSAFHPCACICCAVIESVAICSRISSSLSNGVCARTRRRQRRFLLRCLR